MRSIVLLLFVLGAPVVWAQTDEPDLSGLWHRENGAVIEGKRSSFDSTWSFTLVRPAAGAGQQAAGAVGRVILTGLRWNGSGKWTKGKVLLANQKKSTEVDCELIFLDDKTAELRVTAFFSSRSETLRR